MKTLFQEVNLPFSPTLHKDGIRPDEDDDEDDGDDDDDDDDDSENMLCDIW